MQTHRRQKLGIFCQCVQPVRVMCGYLFIIDKAGFILAALFVYLGQADNRVKPLRIEFSRPLKRDNRILNLIILTIGKAQIFMNFRVGVIQTDTCLISGNGSRIVMGISIQKPDDIP